jgi:hypothetical protein
LLLKCCGAIDTIAATLDEMTVDAALKDAQAITERIIEQAGYPK